MPYSLDESTVRHVALLSRLKVADDEIARFARQIAAILDYMGQLNELDTSGVEPTAHPLPVSNVFRQDVETPPLGVERTLANAPDRQDSFFRVPKVLDRDSA